MICHIHQPRSIGDVTFIPATTTEIADGFLGWVTCLVDGAVRLSPMRVRVLRDGSIQIKVRRGGTDLYGAEAESFDGYARLEIHELIEASPEFRDGLAAIGFSTGDPETENPCHD